MCFEKLLHLWLVIVMLTINQTDIEEFRMLESNVNFMVSTGNVCIENAVVGNQTLI